MSNVAPKSDPPVVGSITFGPGTVRGQLPSEAFARAMAPAKSTMFDELAAAATRSIAMGETLVRNLTQQVTDQANEIHRLNHERNEAICFLLKIERAFDNSEFALGSEALAFLDRLGLGRTNYPVETLCFIADIDDPFADHSRQNPDRQQGGK